MARILIIEDNPDNLELMIYLLEAFGHTIEAAANGEVAIQTIERSRFDLIVCDVHLPRIDGYEVVREVKARAEFENVPVIAVTALAMVGDRERLMTSGFDGYVAKPIEPRNFVRQIEDYLETRAGDTIERRTPTAHAARPEQATMIPVCLGRLLVVDDREENRELFGELLRPHGYQVTTCASAEEALTAASRKVFDLIISDLRMPVHDGLDLLAAMKTDAALSRVPFVFITASKWTGRERRRARQLGAIDFLLRPIEPDELITRLSGYLTKGVRH